MRVLHIYSGNLYGGVETLLATLARCRHFCPNMEPEFALCFEGRLSWELHAAGAIVHAVGPARFRNPGSVWRARRRLRLLLQSKRFDVVVCHMAWPLAIFGPVLRKSGLPLVSWQHGPLSGRDWIERWAGRTTPGLALCNSRFTAELYGGLYPGVQKAVLHYPVIPPAAPPDQIERAAVRRGLNTPEDAIVIIQVSRLTPWKGHTLHLEALAKLRDLDGWVCWIVGGAQRPEEVAYLGILRTMSRRLAIADRVHFLEERSDVQRLLGASDIFCQPNTGPEPFGIALIEALYAGLPVLTTAMGGALEIVDGSCGELLPASDPESLAAALRRFIERGGLRRSVGAACVARARQLCDPQAQIHKLSVILAGI